MSKRFADIYFMKMKGFVTREKVVLYLLIALAFQMLWVFHLWEAYKDTFLERNINTLWRLVYVLVFNYILFEFTFSFVSRKRIILSFLLIFIHLMLYSWGLYGWRMFGIAIGIYTPLYNFKNAEHAVSDQMAFSMMSIFFFGVIRHIYNYVKLKRITQQLRIEKQQAELSYLKSQTNPHFLFNTLNNIYSLARIKSDLAPESILRLSKILRFMLYETGGDFISVEQELKIITDYIELEKLRYDESLTINFMQDIENMKQAIPPLLLMPLVENAFKHGVSETRGRPFINIHLSVNNRQLVFVVKNSTEAVHEEKPVVENIGLSNLRRQLELLYTEYDLSLQQGTGVFIAELKINLASHV